MTPVTKIIVTNFVTDRTVRFTPLLIILLTIALHSDVAANESVQISAAYETQAASSLMPGDAVRKNASFGGAALERSSTNAAPFDYSFFLVVTLGLAGLIWMRRQAQSL